MRFFAIAITLVVVGGSLVTRIIVRGGNYPGWDVLYPAQGLFLVSTRPAADALVASLTQIGPLRRLPGDGDLSAPLNSFVYTWITGSLTRLWPWEYWAHAVSFLLVFTSLLFTIKAAGLSWTDGWIVLFAWGASPPLLSFSLAGYPYASGFFPHAVALWIVLDRRFDRHVFANLVLSALTCVFSWYLYDTARTVFTVFLGAAFLRRDAPLASRAAWLLVGGAQFWTAATWPGVGGVFTPSRELIAALPSALVSILNYIFVTQYLTMPVVFTVGLLSLLVVRRDRLLIAVLLLAQFSLVLLIAAKADHWLRPRRFLMVECYCIVAIARMYAEGVLGAASWPRRAFAIILVMALVGGNAWQVHGLIRFAHTPPQQAMWSLPYTQSQADYMMVPQAAQWADEFASRVEAGEKLIIIYGLAGYGENATNPNNILERVYLRLGHERFVESVFVFAANQCHRDCLPIHPLAAIDAVLDDQFRPGGPISLERVTLYYSQDLYPDYQHLTEPESATAFGAVRRRFSLQFDSVVDEYVMAGVPVTLLRFRIAPRPRDAVEGFRFEAAPSTLERLGRGASDTRPFQWSGPPFEQYWVIDKPLPGPYLLERPWGKDPFAVRLRGRLEILRRGTFELTLGSDEPTRVTLDGRTVLTNTAPKAFRVSRGTVALEPGSYAVELSGEDRAWITHLVFDLYRTDEPTPK